MANYCECGWPLLPDGTCSDGECHIGWQRDLETDQLLEPLETEWDWCLRGYIEGDTGPARAKEKK